MIKEGYYYLYYVLYKFSENAPARFWSEWKAGIALLALEAWTLFSLVIYIEAITGKRFMPTDVSHPAIVVTVVLLLYLKWRMFDHNDKWKEIVKKFDKLPADTNKRYNRIAWLVILFLIINYWVIGIYVLSHRAA